MASIEDEMNAWGHLNAEAYACVWVSSWIIKKSKKNQRFDCFDSLINWDGVDTSYFNEGHCSIDKHIWMLIIMYKNGYNSIPVMAGLKRWSKEIKKSKKIKEFDFFDYMII